MLKVGLTGNIASGKSEVEKIIKKSGYIVYDLDIISHEILENEAREKVLKEFNTTDRKKIGAVVFSDRIKKKKLEDIIYPVLKEKIFCYFEKHKKEPIIFISGALLFESGFNKFFDKIIFIDAKKELRLQRLMKRNNFTEEEAILRINSQNEKNKTSSDFIIENNSDIKILENEVYKTIESLKLL